MSGSPGENGGGSGDGGKLAPASASDTSGFQLQLRPVEPTEFSNVDTVAAAVQEDGELRFVSVNGQLLKTQAAVRAPKRGRHLFLTPDECFMTNRMRTFLLLDDPDPPAESDDSDPAMELNNGRTFNRVALFPHGVPNPATAHDANDSSLRWHFAATQPQETKKHGAQPKLVRVDVDIRNVRRVDATTRLTLRLTNCASKESATATFSPKATKGSFCASFVASGVSPGLYTVELSQFGPGLRGAHVHGIVLRQRNPLHVVRMRWRPYALHNTFRCKQLGKHGADAWMFSLCKTSAGEGFYVAVTTPFGYVGVVLGEDGKVTMPNGLNFSMWSHGRNESRPPLHHRPHFLALDGGAGAKTRKFGHEGFGIKVAGTSRPWKYQHNKWYTFALTVVDEPDQVFADGRIYTFAVWTWSQGKREWQRFAVGRDFFTRKMVSGLNLSAFVEVIGQPHVHRSGDVRREIECRMFARSWGTQHWHRVDDVQLPATNEPENKLRQAKFESFCLSMGGVRMEPARKHQSWATLTSGACTIPDTNSCVGGLSTDHAPSSQNDIKLNHTFQGHDYDASLGKGDVHTELWQTDRDTEGNKDIAQEAEVSRAPDYMQPDKTMKLARAMVYPSIVDVEPIQASRNTADATATTTASKLRFTVHIPAELGDHNVVTIAAGAEDGLSLPEEWDMLFDSGTHDSGEVEIDVPVAKLPDGKLTGLVARVKVTNDAIQVWSDDGFDF